MSIRSLLQHRLIGNVFILSILQFSASVAGVLRDNLLNRTFSAESGVVDAYFAAFRPSDLLFQTCIMSAMGTVLVPVLAQYHAKGDTREMGRVLSGTMGIASLVFGGIALIAGIGFPLLAPVLTKFQGDTLELYITFGRLSLLVNFLFVFGNALGQYLITVERYWMYGLTPILYTAGTMFGTLFLTEEFGVFGPMMGTIFGAVVYVLFRGIAVLRVSGAFAASWWHPEVPLMAKLMTPRILALGSLQAQLLFLDRFASGLPPGSVTINVAARNFQSVLVGVVGIAIAQSVYARLSLSAAKKEAARFRSYLRYGIGLCLALTVPGAVVLVLASPVAARLVHLSAHLSLFSMALLPYALSIPFESLSHLQYRAFYALKDTLTPALAGIIGGVTAVGTAFLLLPRFGIVGIPLGYAAGEVTKALLLAVTLPWKSGQVLNSRSASTEEPLKNNLSA